MHTREKAMFSKLLSLVRGGSQNGSASGKHEWGKLVTIAILSLPPVKETGALGKSPHLVGKNHQFVAAIFK